MFPKLKSRSRGIGSRMATAGVVFFLMLIFSACASSQLSAPTLTPEPSTPTGAAVENSPTSPPTSTPDPYGKEVIAKIMFQEPRGMIKGFDSIWVNIWENTLYRLDPVTGEILVEIKEKIGSEPAAMAVTDDALWVINASSRSISRVDPYTNQVTDRFEFSDICCSLAVFDEGVYTIDFDKTLSRIDVNTKEITSFTITNGQLTDGSFASESGIWVQLDGNTLQFFDPATGSFGKSFQYQGAFIGFANGLFFTVTDQNVMGFDPETGDQKVSISADGQQVAKFGFDSAMLDFNQLGQINGDDLWIIGQDSASLYLLIKIDLSTQKILQTIHVGQSPGGFISMVVDGNKIWLSDTRNQVLMITP